MKKNKTPPASGPAQARGFNRLSQGLHGALSSLMSNLRLSLTFRIAIHYAFQLLCTTPLVCLFITLCYAGAQLPQMQQTMQRIAALTPDSAGIYAAEDIQEQGVTACLETGELSSSAKERLGEYFYALFTRSQWRPEPVVTLASGLVPGHTLYVSFAIGDRLAIWLSLMGGVLFCDLWRIISFLRHKDRLDKSVLRPIRDITYMAATLSASNLSNRINIAGTKNELKDLAVVINSMLDRIERSYNSQKQFVSDASHELRTPIAVIQGYVSMLERWGKTDKAVLDEGISAISQEAASMKELVERLLFLARHDKKTLMLEMEVFDPLEVMSEVHREAKLLSPVHRFELSPAQNARVNADKGMLKQLMRILVDNAIKYTPDGGSITLGVRRDSRTCYLSVTDTGAGISAEDLPKVFDRFYRCDEARKSQTSGHGLGLSIARIIVAAHGGHLKVRSKVDAGTTFTACLPLERG